MKCQWLWDLRPLPCMHLRSTATITNRVVEVLHNGLTDRYLPASWQRNVSISPPYRSALSQGEPTLSIKCHPASGMPSTMSFAELQVTKSTWKCQSKPGLVRSGPWKLERYYIFSITIFTPRQDHGPDFFPLALAYNQPRGAGVFSPSSRHLFRSSHGSAPRYAGTGKQLVVLRVAKQW